MHHSPITTGKAVNEKACDAQSISDRTAFHLAGIGAALIGAAARLRETCDLEIGETGVAEAIRELEQLQEILADVERGKDLDAARMLDDLIFNKVLRRLT